jgi:uncharacterized protein YggE
MRLGLFALTAIITLITPLAATAQASGATSAVPQILTTASADVELKPDRATLVFTVESRGSTAAKAGAETARKQKAVIDTLRAMGIGADQMTTASVEISPEYVYPGQNQAPRVSGYVARNSVRVEILRLEQAGAVIDAGLTKESSGIGSLAFYSSKADEARRQAIELAVLKAKNEAESMAKAAGGALGTLIELSAQPSYERPMASPMVLKSMSAAAIDQTPVSPGQLKISATVSGRWGFVPR